MIGARTPTLVYAAEPRGPRHDHCLCGGVISLSIEPLFGRTLERCNGACGYIGAPRLTPEAAAEVASARSTIRKYEYAAKTCPCGKVFKARRPLCYTCDEQDRARRKAAGLMRRSPTRR